MTHEPHGVGGSNSQSAKVTPGGHRSHKHSVVTNVGLHADPVTEDRTSGEGTGRVNRENRNSLPIFPEAFDQNRDQSRFANPGRSGESDYRV
jgi:hypothetical protein